LRKKPKLPSKHCQERQAAKTVETEAAKSAKPFEEEAARLQKIVNQKKSPVDEFANYVLAENAPDNIKKAAAFVARSPEGKQAFQDATISMLARVPKSKLKDLYYTRVKYALEGSGLYTPKQIDELSRRVDAARDPTILEKVIQGWFTAVASGEIPSRVNSGINSITQLAPF
jgi:GTPase Era involved in 16S rRNA processing